MKNKNLVRWLCLLLMVVTAIGVTVVSAAPKAAPEGLVLEDMPIVLPANATDVEKTAAKELQHYLREITGSASSMITEGVAVDSAIYLGSTKFAKENNVTYTDKNGMGEGWTIKAIGNRLVITGGEARGTLYGVYHLLEDVFGVHWWNMWEEYIPEMDDAVLPYDFESSGEPVFADRGIYSNETLSTLYYARNRQNGWTSNAPQAYGGEEDFTRPYHVHTFNHYYPAFYTAPSSAYSAKWKDAMNPDGVDFFIEHPEWYSYSKARGERISYGQMCMSNEELIADFREKALLAIQISYEDADAAGKDRPSYISITPNDLGGLCECEACEASTAIHGKSGHLLVFVNKIAERVAEVYPEIKVETLAYARYFEVPLDDTVPADNVIIRLASSDVNGLRDLDHWTNQAVKERLYKWGERLQPGQLWMWNYAVNYSVNGVFPNVFNFHDDLQKLDEAGGFGAFYELQSINTSDFWDLKHWVLTKAMEDPYADAHEVVKTFTYGYYGEAAGQDIYEYLVYMDEQYEDCDMSYNFSDKFINAPWLTAAEVKKGNAYFDAAIAKTEANDDLSDEEKELFLNRIAAARAGLDRQILANYDKYVDEMYAAGELFGISRREVGLRMVASYQWLITMELEDDYTGTQAPGKRGNLGGDITTTYSEFVSPTDQVTGELIDRPAIPQQIYEDHPGLSDAHIYDYTASTFWDASTLFGYIWIGTSNEASYPGGTSALLNHAVYAKQNNGTVSSYFTFSENKVFRAGFNPGWYLGDSILNDGEWHLYRAEDVIALRSTRLTFWDDSLRLELADMEHLYNKPVDVYVSMKVTGDPSGEDPNNYARVWVDRVILVEDCSHYDVNYTGTVPATCHSNQFQTGTCPVCGQEARKEVDGTKLPHTLTGSYVYDPETNTYSNTCSVCGEVEYADFHAELPQKVLDVLAEKGVPMDFIHDYGTEAFSNGGVDKVKLVQDTDSPLGKAFLYDVNVLGANTYFTIDNNRGIYTWLNKIPAGEVPKADAIITDGDYHIYRMKNVKLISGTGNNLTKLFLFDCSWCLNVPDLAYLEGKTVDLFLSFKVEGELKYDTAGQMPKYYIDRVIVVEDCSDHTPDSYVYNPSTGMQEGTCSTCGKLIQSDLPLGLLEDLSSGAANTMHIDDYDASVFELPNASIGGPQLVSDTKAHNGKAVYVPGGFTGADINFSFVRTGKFMSLSAAELQANDGKGYRFYKLDDVVIPTMDDGNLGYLYSFSYGLQCRGLQGYFNAKMGYTMDFYLSVKVEGSDLSIDRFIVVDNCYNHADMSNAEKLTEAFCYMGETYSSTCTVCKSEVVTERTETRLPHKWSDYVLDAHTGKQVASCLNTGCTETKSYDPNTLPTEVQQRLTELNLDISHAHIYGADDLFTEGTFFASVNDADAYNGKAVFSDSNTLANPNAIEIVQDVSFRFSNEEKRPGWFRIPMADLKANSNNGYKLYSFEDLTVPNTDSAVYFHAFNHHLRLNKSSMSLFRAIEGGTVDIYVSMKVTGYWDWRQPYPAYWVDRIIIVDRCDDYEIEYKVPENTSCADSNVIYTGYCPVCSKAYTKTGENTSNHSFTKYIALDPRNAPNTFTAACDFGCGTTHTKTVETQNWRDLLPDELPETAKAHVIQAYRVPEFHMSGEENYLQLDPNTGLPVGVRAYDPTLSSSIQYALNTSGGLLCAMYLPGIPAGIGSWSGDEIKANADDGQYHLYALKGVVPVKVNNYRYFYFFSDWVGQIEMFDDDLLLRGYQNKVVDLYLYMKVDGDPTCASADKPTYYIDQIIVAESCQTDETWTVIREATCTQRGEMVGDCAVCGLKNATVTTPMVDHVIEDSVVRKQPTCKTNMLIHGKCSVCGTTPDNGVEVPGTMLEHSFTNYVKNDDGSGTEYAFCDNGCGERHVRNIVSTGENLQLPEVLQPIVPILGGAAGGRNFSFSDIKESDWYFSNVKEAWENKLIDGVTSTEFRPNETLTVAQAIKLASAYHQRYNTSEVSLTNGAGNWYSSYVDYAVENSIIDSKYASYGTAQMNKAIDRSEFVAIFANAMDAEELVGYNTVADDAIPGVKMTDTHAKAIYQFYRAGILTGSDAKGTFNPKSNIKRSEVAAILSRMFDSNVRQSITLN